MLPPEPHQQKYQEFHQALLRLQGAARETAPNRAALLKEASALQQFFQDQILSLSVEELPPELMPWLQSYHTETHKQLRLLAADLSFWQAARQPGTIEQRRATVRRRLETLISYSETVLG